MAYDKVIDSSALDANLASIAEAIRTKGGTTDQLVFPAGFISAIEAIEAGGSKFVAGSFTPNENVSKFTINHELGEIPNIYVVYTYDADGSQTELTNIDIILICPDITAVNTYFGYATRVSGGTTYKITNRTTNGQLTITEGYSNKSGRLISEANETKCMVTYATGSTSQCYFYAGFEYKFLIGRYDFV